MKYPSDILDNIKKNKENKMNYSVSDITKESINGGIIGGLAGGLIGYSKGYNVLVTSIIGVITGVLVTKIFITK